MPAQCIKTEEKCSAKGPSEEDKILTWVLVGVAAAIVVFIVVFVAVAILVKRKKADEKVMPVMVRCSSITRTKTLRHKESKILSGNDSVLIF